MSAHTNNNGKAICPICNSDASLQYVIDKKKIIKGLEAIFNSTMPESIIEPDYSLYTCNNCTLSFAWPLIPGSNNFYDHLTAQPGYYSNYRPEYDIIWNILKNKKQETTILDVGCGDGSFLERTLQFPLIKAMGIDTTIGSVQKSTAKGIETYQSSIESFDKNNFNIIVSFHCLEHIADPVDFLAQMSKRLKPGGTLFISTPYSPVSYEYFWFHPLNHPPHHLLRLNKKAYETLASKLNLNIKFYNFQKMSFKSHVKSCFSYSKYGYNKAENLYMQMLLSPLLSLKVILKMLGRDKIAGEIAGNDILVEFSKKNN